MFKRALSVFIVLLLAMSGLSLRIVNISKNTVQAANTVSTKSVDLTILKGTIYDCEMRPITNAESEIYIAAKPDNKAVALLKEALVPEIFESVKERLSKGKPVAVKSEKSVESSEFIKTVYVPKRYGNTSFACHIIGYLDGENNGVSGIEKAYNSLLSSEIKIPKVRFFADANGRAMLGEKIAVENNEIPQTGVVLTIDKDIQQITEIALDKSGAECAAAVVMDIESGAIKACVSRPAFDRNNLTDALDDEHSPLINRALLPFSVGSVFKPVVAAAALESGIESSFEYNCTGSVTYNGVTFHCHKRSGHGMLDMRGAVANSCNTYFITLALETGAGKIVELSRLLGFGKETVLCEGISSAAGYLPEKNELDSKAAVANLSFGQGSLLATPVQICAMMASIAKGGALVKPYLVEGEVNSNGKYIKIENYREKIRVISEETAEILKKCLESVVTEGSGKKAESEFVSAAGKTATAQTGKTKNGEELYNTWFAGYFPADNPRYAIAVIRENDEEGAVSCAPVFKLIAETVALSQNNRP